MPDPLNYVDWRSPYDNLFIWTEGKKKFVVRGGSGSSQARENNSRFIYALGLINQRRLASSHLLVYSSSNQLQFLQSFPSLTIPCYDIGSNYGWAQKDEGRCLKGARFLDWQDFAQLKQLFIS